MSLRRILAAGSISLAVAACGGAAATSGASQPTGGGGSSLPAGGTGTAAQSQAPTASSGGSVTGHVGDKLTFANFANDPVDATLVKVTDPATPNKAPEAPLPPATHWVGVEVTVNDTVDHDTDAAGFDAVTSAGTTVTTTNTYQGSSTVLGDGFQGCTQTDGTPQDVPTYTYCAAFPVPDGQTVVKVGLNVTGAPLVTTDQATWSVP